MEFVSYGRGQPSGAGGSSGRPAGRSRTAPGRVDWVDTAKGICIVLVVMMHATLGVGDAMGGEGFMHTVVAFSKPFRMPDFFLVSGLFLSRVIDRDWRTYADKRVVHFVYFYLLWLVIQSLFKYGQLSGGSPAGFAAHLVRSLVEPFSTLWFIYMLAIFSVVTKLLRGAPWTVVLALATALQILPIETSSFLFNEFCERWVYFLVGYLFASRIFAFAELTAARPIGALCGLAGWAAINGVLALTPLRLGWASTLAELPLVGVVLGVAGALAIVAFAAILSRTALAHPARYAGRNSIAIYLAFFLPMAVTRQVLIATGAVSDIGFVSLITTAVAVLVPLAIERGVRHTRLSFLFRRPDWARLRPLPARGPVMQAAE